MPGTGSNASQIPLELPLEASSAREDLITGPSNRLAVALIDRWPDWPSNTVILAGPVGSGKSHLARIWAERSGASILDAAAIPQAGELPFPGRCAVVEDAGHGRIDEEGLFHLYNTVRAHGGSLLLTSREFPAAWQITIADLASRIRSAHVVELAEPDDALLSAVITKLFSDRQMEVPPALVSYLVARMERSLGVAAEIVSWLDREALARRARVTRALAAEALEAVSAG